MAETTSLSIGSPAPLFTLPATDGTELALEKFRFLSNVYLFFVREFI